MVLYIKVLADDVLLLNYSNSHTANIGKESNIANDERDFFYLCIKKIEKQGK
jgi:hypothetical protein